jgi:small subunit ribosomal protein S9
MAIKKPIQTEEPVAPVLDEEEVASVDALVEADDAKGGPEKYYQAVGRRKESIARIRLYTKKSSDVAGEEKAIVTVNNLNYTDYFKDVNFQHVVESPLRKLKSLNRFKATVIVNGGGLSGQAGAIKHGISRALELFDSNFRKKLKKSGFLTRDSRAKERRKYGLKKARKAPQWNKR